MCDRLWVRIFGPLYCFTLTRKANIVFGHWIKRQWYYESSTSVCRRFRRYSYTLCQEYSGFYFRSKLWYPWVVSLMWFITRLKTSWRRRERVESWVVSRVELSVVVESSWLVANLSRKSSWVEGNYPWNPGTHTGTVRRIGMDILTDLLPSRVDVWVLAPGMCVSLTFSLEWCLLWRQVRTAHVFSLLLVVLERLTHLKTRLATAFASCC